MDCNNTQTEELTYAKNKDLMYDDDLLKNNHFNGLCNYTTLPMNPYNFRWARLE